MKTVQFKDIHKYNFDIHNIIIIHHSWQNGESFRTPPGGRPDNGIMFLSNCAFEYIDDNGSVRETAPQDSIVYAPKNAEYSCRFRIPSIKQGFDFHSDYLINFLLFDEKGNELRLSDDRMTIATEKSRYYFDSFARIDGLGLKGLSPSARVKSMLYDLICDISLDLEKSDIMTRHYAAIYPAIRYIERTNLAEIDPSTLAERCRISPSCFRRLFREYTGMPPLEYINHLKVQQARTRLQSGVLSVAEVAESLGFTDASYFSRFYKKATGHSPTEDRG